MDSLHLLNVARDAAHAAAKIIRDRAADRAMLTWDEKGPADFVSDVDRTAERAIRAHVTHALPEVHLLGEEFSPTFRIPERGVVFVADPLDGTTNYLHGYQQYAVSIGVLVDGVLAAGIVHNVVTGDDYTAAAGGGAYRNAERVTVSPITTPSRSLIGTGFPFADLEHLDQYQRHFAAISRQTAGMRRAGSAALDLVDVACGRFEGFWELTLAPWDIAAGILLVREAGGIVTDLHGAPASVAHTAIIAGNPTMHAWLLDTITHADKKNT